MKKKTNKTGFTLIEILVVSTIIVIVSAIGLVSYSGAQVGARDAQRKQDLDNTRTTVLLYRSENGQYPIASLTSHNRVTLSLPRKVIARLATALRPPVVFAVVNSDLEIIEAPVIDSEIVPTASPTSVPDPTVLPDTGATPQEAIAYGLMSDILQEEGYISKPLPVDPINDSTYYYGYSSDGTSFSLTARLEKDASVVELTN